MKINSNLFKKCKKCVKFDKKTKQCSYYNSLAKEKCLNCEFDKRKVCEICKHWDPKTCYCALLTMGRFKDGEVLRICNNFKNKV